MNNKEAVHPSDDLTDDDYSNIKDHKTQHEQTNQKNSFYTLIDNESQSNPQLEDQNWTNDWKTTNNHEGKLVIAYNTNAGNNTLYPRTLYTLYIGPTDAGIGHLVFKVSTKHILTTMR